MKKIWKWIIGIVVVLVVLAAVVGVVFLFRSHLPVLVIARWDEPGLRTRLPGMMPFGHGDWDGRGWMMPFGGLFGGLLSLGLLALVVLGIVWLMRRLTVPNTPPPPAPACGHCGKPIQAGWIACPYCGKKL